MSAPDADMGRPGGLAGLVALLRNPAVFRLGTVIAEQGLIAVTSLGTLAVLSRLISLHELGIVATGLALWMLIEALQRAMVILPFVAIVQQPERDRSRFGAFILLNLLLCGGAWLVLYAAGAGISLVNADFGRAMILGGPLAAAGCLFLYVRHALYQLERPILAALNAVGVAALTTAGLLLLYSRGNATADEAVLVIAVAYALPSFALLLWVSLRASFSWRALVDLASHHRLMAEFTAASLALHLATNGVQLLLGFFSGPAGVAIFALARTLVRPLTLIVHAVVDIDRSRLSRQLAEHGFGGVSVVVSASRLALIWLTAPLVAAILLFPEPLLALFYGEAGGSAVTASRLWVVVLIPFILYEPLEAALSVMRESRALARSNLIALGAAAVLVAVLLPLGLFDVNTAILAIGVAYLACMVSVYRRYDLVKRRAAAVAP